MLRGSNKSTRASNSSMRKKIVRAVRSALSRTETFREMERDLFLSLWEAVHFMGEERGGEGTAHSPRKKGLRDVYWPCAQARAPSPPIFLPWTGSCIPTPLHRGSLGGEPAAQEPREGESALRPQPHGLSCSGTLSVQEECLLLHNAEWKNASPIKQPSTSEHTTATNSSFFSRRTRRGRAELLGCADMAQTGELELLRRRLREKEKEVGEWAERVREKEEQLSAAGEVGLSLLQKNERLETERRELDARISCLMKLEHHNSELEVSLSSLLPCGISFFSPSLWHLFLLSFPVASLSSLLPPGISFFSPSPWHLFPLDGMPQTPISFSLPPSRLIPWPYGLVLNLQVRKLLQSKRFPVKFSRQVF